jgi:uncharacterized protein (UPF0333 family)
MKSQVALEYLVIASIAIALMLPIFYYSFGYSSASTSTYQAQDSINALAKAADYVYSLGVGSKTHVSIIIPNNVVSSSIANKTILLKIKASSGTSDIVAFTKANVNGTVPTTSGYHYMQLNMTEQGVQISPS